MELTEPECNRCKNCDVSGTEVEDLWCTFWNELVADFDARTCPAYQPVR